MPVRVRKDSKGCFAQWGRQTKYYYECGDANARERAKTKAAKQGAAAHASGYKENDMAKKLQKTIVNFTGKVHYDQIGEKKYLVAPMIMLTEGVHEGSEGPLFYPGDEISKTPEVWNHKPVILYHPQAGISACDPVILSNRQVGLIMNTRAGKISVSINNEKKKIVALKAEAWLDEERMAKIDERISQAIEKNEMMELSTGLFTDNAAEEGEWNGTEYDTVARNYRPDHLALLPDLKGACSIEDGAGFLKLNAKAGKIAVTSNAMSHSNIRSLLNSWLQEKDDDVWIEDVYDEFFVFMKDGKLYKGTYSIVDNVIQVTESFTEVIRVTEYRTKDGEFIGNRNEAKRKELEMKKEQTVDALIKSNSNSWLEKDRDALMKMDESFLTKMTDSEKLAAEKAVENAAKKAADELAAKKKVEEEATVLTANANGKEKTVEDYINDKSMPAKIRNVFRSGIATYDAVKNQLIERLIKNDKNQFTKEELQEKDNDELKKLVSLMAPISSGEDGFKSDFEALGVELTRNKEEGMAMPAVVG